MPHLVLIMPWQICIFIDRFAQVSIVQLFEETVVSPVRWKRLHDVKAAVMGDEPVVVQVAYQIRDL